MKMLNGFNIPVLQDSEVLINQSYLGMRQLTIMVNDKFPSSELSEKYERIVIDQGFVSCKNELKGWDTFLDGTVKPNIRVFRKISYYMNYESKVLGMILTSYDSENIQSKFEPDNDDQFVTVLLYTFDSLSNEIERLDVNCFMNE